MNEHIDKLFGEALDLTSPETWAKLDQEQMARFKDKFGELILEDVMSICEDLGDKGMDGHYCVDAIRNKFGLWPVVLDSEEST